jgi:hypothetical protein
MLGTREGGVVHSIRRAVYNGQPILQHGCMRSYSRDAGPSIWIVELGIHIVQLATDSQRQRMRGWRSVVGIPGITHVSVLLLHQLHQRVCICAYALHKQTFPAAGCLPLRKSYI